MTILDVLLPRAANNDYYLRTPPGKIGNLPMLALSLGMVVLAIRNAKMKQGTG